MSDPSGGTPKSSNPFEGLSIDKLKESDLPTKLMLGGSLAFFIFSFFDWWSVSSGPFSVSGNAFDNFRGTFAWLLMIAVGVLAVMVLLKGAVQNLVYAGVACSGLAVLMTLWFWVAIPDSGVAQVDSSAAFGLYISLITAIVATAGAVMALLEMQKNA